MGPLPKRKVSRTRRNKRRAHDSLSRPHLLVCENCGEYHVAHRACPHCGTYNGRDVVDVSDD